MIKREDLLDAIAECNGVKYPNAHTCMMLAAFYTILDHIDESEISHVELPQVSEKYSFSAQPETVGYESQTEFGQQVAGMDTYHVLEVIDELMTTLQVINPRLYNGVMIKMAE